MRYKILNTKYICFLLCIFTILYLLFTIFTIPARAQGLSMGIWPPLLEVMIQPGKSITQVYKLQNEGETDLVLTSSLLPFKPANERGNVELASEVSSYNPGSSFGSNDPGSISSGVDWFSFQNADLALGENFVLKAGRQQEIVLKIKIPPQAKEDDYYLTLLFETVPGETLGNLSQSFAQIKIGSHILLTVSATGETLKKAEISEFSLANCLFSLPYLRRSSLIGQANKEPNKEPKFEEGGGKVCLLDSFARPEFLIKIKNTGKAFFKPMGKITTTGWFSQQYFNEILPENILINSSRQIRCAGKQEEAIVAKPCRLESRFLFGSYRSALAFGPDKAEEKYRQELTFWAFPFKLTLALLTSAVLFTIVKSRLKTEEMSI